MPPEEINNRRQILEIRMEKKMPTSATNELGKHPSEKVRTELLGKSTTKGYELRGLMETSRNLR